MRDVFAARLAKAALILAGSTAALALPTAAQAQTADLTVNATVTANCTVSTTALDFGNVNTLSGADVDGTGGVTVTCTNGTDWSAAADAGNGSGATLADRRMTGGGNLLSYSLFIDAARTTVWGDGTGTTATVDDTGTGLAQNFTVYGRVGAGQTGVPAGGYTDTVGVTVTY